MAGNELRYQGIMKILNTPRENMNKRMCLLVRRALPKESVDLLLV